MGGDTLFVKFEGHENTNTLITSSAASKFYSCEAGLPKQKISQDLTVKRGSLLEWVPHENIFFEGSKTELQNKISCLTSLVFWLGDNGFGRLESDKNSFGGTLRSTTTITIDSQLIHRDFFDYSPEMGQSSWGLNGKRVIGSLIATSPYIENEEFTRLFSDIKKTYVVSHLEPREKKVCSCCAIWGARSRSVSMAFTLLEILCTKIKRSCSVVMESALEYGATNKYNTKIKGCDLWNVSCT